jgi:hypothetical protein
MAIVKVTGDVPEKTGDVPENTVARMNSEQCQVNQEISLEIELKHTSSCLGSLGRECSFGE